MKSGTLDPFQWFKTAPPAKKQKISIDFFPDYKWRKTGKFQAGQNEGNNSSHMTTHESDIMRLRKVAKVQ